MSGQVYQPGRAANTVRAAHGRVVPTPEGWAFLPAGDATLTRRVKLAGDHWIVQSKRGRRTITLGVWAAAETIERIRAELTAERSTESYAKRRVADAKRRHRTQVAYVEDFNGAVIAYLRFHPNHAALAEELARAVTKHATPIGSGTVARTKQIPVERRAAAAVIAWMRHQTTDYDSMPIPRKKGERREVRKQLAKTSRQLLSHYRGRGGHPANCPLIKALQFVPPTIPSEKPGKRTIRRRKNRPPPS